ncbi:MAG TPA: helix-turn-helix domain-containing protein [Candidatus Paceibacterota bacterium]|nr:helix-turn-helix domain-containing protein [Candidatus Paceibacterota bacterium]
MLEQLLKQLGFTDKEITIYLCVLEHGKLSAAAVARLTKINRTTVYSVGKVLLEKGVITEDIGGTNRYFSAVSPEELRALYKKEEAALAAKKQSIEQLITELASVPKNKNYSVPKIRFIDERHLDDFLHKQLPVWIESAKAGQNADTKNWWGFQDTSFIDAYPDWFKYHWQIFPSDYGTRLFTNKKPAEEKFAEHVSDTGRRQVKYWAKSKDFTATHAVLGDYVLFAITHQHPHYAVEIHDAVMAENIREMFKGMWEEIKS